jgi:MscS family membrane protein
LGRDSPQSSVVAFLEAAHAQNYGRALRYLDLRGMPEDRRLADGTQLARELQTILDRDTQFDVGNLSRSPEGDLSDSLPPNRDRVDTFQVNGQTLELDLERITLHSGLSVWVFSSDSIAKIPLIAQQTNNSIIERHLPLPLVNWQLIDTPLWRWIGLVLLAFALAALSKLLSRSALWLTQEGLRRAAAKWDPGILRTFVGPLRLLLSVSLFRAGMEWFAPSLSCGFTWGAFSRCCSFGAFSGFARPSLMRWSGAFARAWKRSIRHSPIPCCHLPEEYSKS